MSRHNGVVVWYNNAEGYGVLHGDSGIELFIHADLVRMGSCRGLGQGDVVQFELIDGGSAPRVLDVVRLDCR